MFKEENMKKLFAVLSIAGMIAALVMPVSAADVKITGEYYMYGGWESNHSLKANDPQGEKTSTDAIAQRLRIQSVFQVAEGLKLTTRFDAMERIWGQESSVPEPGILDRSEKNISWERAYITFNLGPGFFDVGYQTSGNWSPIAFGNTTSSVAGIKYTAKKGPVTLAASWMKGSEKTTALGDGAVVIFTNSDTSTKTSASTTTGSTYAYSSGDRDNYALEGTFKWKSGQAGLKVLYVADERNSGQYGWLSEDTAGPVITYANASVRYWEFSPFFQAKFGPVDLEAKLYYDYGKADFRLASATDVDLRGLSYYANGKVNIGPAYIGVMYAYMQGDNDSTDATLKYGHNGGQDWDPCLIIGNDRYLKWMGGLYKYTPKGYASAGPFTAWYAEQNAKIIQGYVGVNPIPTLALKASFTNARQDYVTNNALSKDIGNELDITATYKIYPNLSYMIGFGYWWVGDYFQGSSAANQLDNNYLLMHQLTLTF
jgi:hypothetical protein